MHAMQYEITLPADYEMGIIRRRVATKGHLLDDFPGLGLKAYLIRERGTDGAPVNQYAPFYLWADSNGMSRFLWGGGGFQGVVESFGRPTVQHWTGAAFQQGPAATMTPRAATRDLRPIRAEADPTETIAEAIDALRARVKIDGVHSSAVAVDPRHWQIVHFTLWEDTVAEPDGIQFEVLHLSSPRLKDMADDRGSPQGGHP